MHCESTADYWTIHLLTLRWLHDETQNGEYRTLYTHYTYRGIMETAGNMVLTCKYDPGRSHSQYIQDISSEEGSFHDSCEF